MSAAVSLSPGTLAPPACYPTEQDRFNAYVAAIIATISGGIQWEASASAPSDQSKYWLRVDGSGRPLEALKWSTSDGAWIRWVSEPNNTASSGGSSNAYTLSNSPAATAAAAYRPGAIYVFKATFANTGAATMNVDGLGAVAIKKRVSVDLEANDITAGKVVIIVHDGTNFQMVSPERPATSPFEKATTEILGLPAFGASTTQAHGLTAPAEWWNASLVCTTAQSGYSVGDQIELFSLDFNFDQSQDVPPDGTTPYKVTFNATSYTVTCPLNPSSANEIIVYNKTTGDHELFVPGNWKLRVFCARLIP